MSDNAPRQTNRKINKPTGPSVPSDDDASERTSASGTSRRQFVVGAARKAAYMAPVVASLAATQTAFGASSS